MHHDENWVEKYDYGYNENIDTVNIPGHTSAYIRLRLDDIAGNGGAEGRWILHCHITQHGARGMVSEIVVGPQESTVSTPLLTILQFSLEHLTRVAH